MAESFEVQLAIYDLSRGMARGLSGQLGLNIDLIPHTGVVVFGREYFFGAGIQSEDPHEFRRQSGMFPIRTESLGRTRITQRQFEDWCRSVMQSGRYSASSYDLLHRNCNNFAHDAAVEGLRMPRGVPDWVLQVPQRFLSSPMGQMVRPMLEQMQLTSVAGAQPLAPLATAAPPLAAAAANNPWANMSPNQNMSSNEPAPAVTQTAESTKGATPLLDSYTKPLLSSDTKMVAACVNKLLPGIDTDTDKKLLEQIGQLLVKGASLDDMVADAGRLLHDLLQRGFQTTFCLFFLRVVVLQSPPKAYRDCLQWLVDQLSSGDQLASPASRTAAWLTAANACRQSLPELESLVDAAVTDIGEGQPRKEVRQAAASFLYNATLLLRQGIYNDQVPDAAVAMLCACCEGLAEETDGTTRLRRLMVLGRILQPRVGQTSAAAKSLMVDLGYANSLNQLVVQSGQSGDAETARKLATEITQILV